MTACELVLEFFRNQVSDEISSESVGVKKLIFAVHGAL